MYDHGTLLIHVQQNRGSLTTSFMLLSTPEWIVENVLQGLNWPANLSDLNPIEHVWDFVGRVILNRTYEEILTAKLTNLFVLNVPSISNIKNDNII